MTENAQITVSCEPTHTVSSKTELVANSTQEDSQAAKVAIAQVINSKAELHQTFVTVETQVKFFLEEIYSAVLQDQSSDSREGDEPIKYEDGAVVLFDQDRVSEEAQHSLPPAIRNLPTISSQLLDEASPATPLLKSLASESDEA